jgi:hypothetical protein
VHRAGYLHRDIKPSNIMLRPDGRPVLLDFGSARSALSRGTRAVTSLVTPGYAPYEQYYNDGNQGPWTDIYALGAILHQIVSGKPPVEAPARLKNDPLPSARALGAGRYPEPVLDAIDWAMAFDETQRPQSVAAWRRALAGDMKRPQPLIALRHDGIASRNPPPRRRGLLIAASLAVLAIASATTYGVYEYRAVQQEAARETMARQVAQRDAEHAAELQAASLAREIEAREDAERLRKASEETAEKARAAEEKRKAEDVARAAAAEKERQAEQARRIRESEEQTRKALAEAESRRDAEARNREQASRDEQERVRDEQMRRGPDRGTVNGPVFGRTVTRDQIGRPRILTGPINPQAQPSPDLRGDPDADRQRGRDSGRFVQNDQQRYDAENDRWRADERARAAAEREQLQREVEQRRQRQQDDLRLLEEQRLRDRR